MGYSEPKLLMPEADFDKFLLFYGQEKWVAATEILRKNGNSMVLAQLIPDYDGMSVVDSAQLYDHFQSGNLEAAQLLVESRGFEWMHPDQIMAEQASC